MSKKVRSNVFRESHPLIENSPPAEKRVATQAGLQLSTKTRYCTFRALERSLDKESLPKALLNAFKYDFEGVHEYSDVIDARRHPRIKTAGRRDSAQN